MRLFGSIQQIKTFVAANVIAIILQTFLPALQELLASDNYLTMLDKDFHGLPVLCWADLSNNQIVALGRDLVSKTHCRIHDGVHESNFGTLKIYLKGEFNSF